MVSADNKKCYGCSACAEICPKGCIRMVPNEEGFLYPQADAQSCVNCGLCDRVCPIDKQTDAPYAPAAFAGRNRDEAECAAGSSGGIFLPLAKSVVARGGVVFGVAFSERFTAEHQCAETVEDARKFCGSKYIQSDVNHTFPQVKEALEQGREVLFSGTACQIAGLKNYLGKEYDSLYTLDLICHGVPSPKLWEKYLQSLHGKLPKSVSFRDKSRGWRFFRLTIDWGSRTLSQSHKENKFFSLFLTNFILRESCFTCGFKMRNIRSDLTLADFWGVGNVVPEMNDDKGVSLILQNTEKGRLLLDRIAQDVWLVPVDTEQALRANEAARKVPARNPRREKYLSSMRKDKSFSYIYRNCYHSSIPEKICSVAKKTLGR